MNAETPNSPRTRQIKFGPIHVLVRDENGLMRIERIARNAPQGKWDFSTEKLPLTDEFRARTFRSAQLLRKTIREEYRLSRRPAKGDTE